MKTKTVKDAIHGYIRLEEPFWRIIDTAEFQRLKWIEQTSYRVLYPSARHDRFIHSIGVFHLGQRAVDGFLNNCSRDEAEIVKKYRSSFLFACLLHDVGHAPFSHNCEDLYNYGKNKLNIDSTINVELVNEFGKALKDSAVVQKFKEDYTPLFSDKAKLKAPAEHEVMSALVVCSKFDEFSSFFGDDRIFLDLAVRSILGCTYSFKKTDKDKKEIGIKNCLIRLLNSSTVDVDKLDYIARDTRMTGFDTIILDTERLLDSVCVCHGKDGVYYPAFKKSALSVINNVVEAKNAFAKWIVNHPVVLYDSFILRRALGETLKSINKAGNQDAEGMCKRDSINEAENQNAVEVVMGENVNKMFSPEALSKKGTEINGYRFSFLSDMDILFLMKQNIENPVVNEFFSRKDRKKPIWKSNEEFLFCLSPQKSEAVAKAKKISEYIVPLILYLKNRDEIVSSKEINSALLEELKKDDVAGNKDLIDIIDVLLKYKESKSKEEYKFVLLPAKSNFYTTINSKMLYIRFADGEAGFASYSELTDEKNDAEKKEYDFFYLYSDKKIDSKLFLKYLYDVADKGSDIVQ